MNIELGPPSSNAGEYDQTFAPLSREQLQHYERTLYLNDRAHTLTGHHQTETHQLLDEIADEQWTVLKRHGVHHYSIFLHPETHQLFAYAEIESEERWAAIASTPECRRWWAHMADVMPANPDLICWFSTWPSAKLYRIFHTTRLPI